MKERKGPIKFLLIPVLAGITVLVAILFAKDATVKRTTSVANTKTVACSASNYSNRTSDSVCGSGYINSGNNCTQTTTTVYSCNSSSHSRSGNTCTYTASISGYTCSTPATSSGGCRCYSISTGGETTLGFANCESTDTYCSEACSRGGYTGPGTNSGNGDENTRCNKSCSSGSLIGDSCYLFNQSSCTGGWSVSETHYSCPNGGGAPSGTTCSYTANSSSSTEYDGNITCTSISYTVEYNKNNSSAIGTTANSTHEYDVAKNLTANGYSLPGHIFNGWNTKADGTGTNYTNQQSVKNLTTTNGVTVTLYAVWNICPAGTYAEAGATSCSPCVGDTYTSTSGQTVCVACEINQVANSTHTGCETKKYTITYDKNNENAVGVTSNSIHEFGVEKNLTPNGYGLDGHIFNGWNTKADGTGTNYSDGQSVIDLVSTNGAVFTLYAKWSACPAGTYAEAGASTCLPCTGDTYTSEEGQAACFACEEDLAANPTHTGCKVKTVICEPGTYLKANGTTSEDCEICPIGYYCPGGEYIPSYEDQGEFLCPANHIDGEPGTILEEYCKIECSTGTYKDEVYASACIKCPDGKTSSAHTVTYAEISPDGTCYSKSKPVDPSNPKTGLFEVGGALAGVLGLSLVAYIILRKRKIVNI